jgi:hypothetical protein
MTKVHTLIHLYQVYHLRGLYLPGPACVGSPFIGNVRCVTRGDASLITCPSCKEILQREKELKSDVQAENEPCELEIRRVILPIEVVFLMEKIPTKYDEDGFVTESHIGLVMRPLPSQVWPYTGQPSEYLYSCFNDLNL